MAIFQLHHILSVIIRRSGYASRDGLFLSRNWVQWGDLSEEYSKQSKRMHLSHSGPQRLIACERLNVIYYMYRIYTMWHCLFKLRRSLHPYLCLQRSLNSTYKCNLTDISKEGRAAHHVSQRNQTGSKLIHPIRTSFNVDEARQVNWLLIYLI